MAIAALSVVNTTRGSSNASSVGDLEALIQANNKKYLQDKEDAKQVFMYSMDLFKEQLTALQDKTDIMEENHESDRDKMLADMTTMRTDLVTSIESTKTELKTQISSESDRVIGMLNDLETRVTASISTSETKMRADGQKYKQEQQA